MTQRQQKLHPATAKKLLQKRLQVKTVDPTSIFDAQFPQQVNFVKDPSKLKALFCTRRAAKSYTAGLYMVHEALAYPGSNILFIGLTRQSAKGIIWKDILKDINKKHNLKAKFNLADLTMTLPNGSVIAVTGVDAEQDDMKKLLGRKYRLACIDEASMYTINLTDLVYGILKPAMVDGSTSATDGGAKKDRGTICLFGTSSNFTRGLFYDITTGKEPGWSLHEWTAHDNPYVREQWQEELDEIDQKRPLYKNTPQYKQWYLNEWVIDEDKLVYRFNEDRNLYQTLPYLKTDGWTYVLGVDTGWEDDNAFVLCAYHTNDPNLYVVKTYNKSHMTFDQVVDKIKEFMADPVMAPHKVVIDGANKQGVESMKQRSSIPFEYADKNDKVTFIEMLNSDLIQGKIKINTDNKILIDEMMSLVWKTDSIGKIQFPKREHPNLPNHLCFVKGTLVTTDKGDVPIEQLKKGDMVLTRNGYNPVYRAGITGKKQVIKLTFSDGSSITSTLDHPFYTDKGFVCAKDLTKTDKLFSIKELPFTVIPYQSVEPMPYTSMPVSTALGRAFTATLMKAKEDQYLVDGTFTTKMVMPTITTSVTWNASLDKNTQNNTSLVLKNDQNLKRILIILIEYVRWLSPGILLKKVRNGILNMPNLLYFLKGLSRPIKTIVGNAVKVVKTISSKFVYNVPKNISQTDMKKGCTAVVLVHREVLTEEEVFSLQICNTPEYFANGLLVSNCDSFLYSWRCGYHYQSTSLEKRLVVGSKEWHEKQNELIWEKEREHLIQQQNGDWPSSSDSSGWPD